MNFFHFNVKVVGRSSGQSAVASAAYCTADKIENERTGIVSDYSRKSDVVFSATYLPQNAPLEFADRKVLWNEVEKKEKVSDARYARRMDLAIPNELSEEQAKELFSKIGEIFTSEGMCFDGGIHWEEGNHHFDFMTTTRPFKEDGSWAEKDKKVFSLDENGERIPIIDPATGEQKKDNRNRLQWKRERVDTVDWDRPQTIERWRAKTCAAINDYCHEVGLESNIDHRSYERQGLQKIPMIHEGYEARKIEREGGVSERCQANREIKHTNSLIEKARKLLNEFKQTLRKIFDNLKIIKENNINEKNEYIDRGDDAAPDRATRSNRTIDGRTRDSGTRDRNQRQADRRTDEFMQAARRNLDSALEQINDINKRRRELLERARRIVGTDRTVDEPSRGLGERERKLDVQSREDDTAAFIRGLSAKDSAAREKLRNSGIEREARDAERARQASERAKAEAERVRREIEQARYEREQRRSSRETSITDGTDDQDWGDRTR